MSIELIGLDHLDDWGVWIAAVVAGATALGLAYRATSKRARALGSKINESIDTLIGRDEIRHPDTGAVLVASTPGLGRRLADMEATLSRLADADDRISALESKFDRHVEQSRHLEELRANEATEMWKAIRAVAESSPTAAIVLPSTEQEVTVTETRRQRGPTP
jgi:hypothetical protein